MSLLIKRPLTEEELEALLPTKPRKSKSLLRRIIRYILIILSFMVLGALIQSY